MMRGRINFFTCLALAIHYILYIHYTYLHTSYVEQGVMQHAYIFAIPNLYIYILQFTLHI